MPKFGDVQLGQYLIQKRVCSLKQINQGLSAQRELRAKGIGKPLGWILLELDSIDEENLCQALAELGVLELECPACREATAIASYVIGFEYKCPRCRTKMSLADPARQKGVLKAAPAPYADPLKQPSSVDNDPMISKVIGGCQILKRIARGGMGIVYEARQLNLGRIVAIKILSEEFSRDRSYVERFIQEARSAAVLSHGNIVHINDVGEHNGIFYFIMEYIDGENLKDILQKKGRLEIPRALEIALQVSEALQHAHSRGIIHRDIKPENIILTREGIVKLADMGLAKRVLPEVSSGITNAGSILGTPFYMAPEQAKDFRQVDQRSDIYSLGVTLYRALAGSVPFDGRSPIEVMIKAIDGKHVPLREQRPEIPEEVESIVERMMSREPENRFQDAGEVIAALKRALVRMNVHVPRHALQEP